MNTFINTIRAVLSVFPLFQKQDFFIVYTPATKNIKQINIIGSYDWPSIFVLLTKPISL